MNLPLPTVLRSIALEESYNSTLIFNVLRGVKNVKKDSTCFILQYCETQLYTNSIVNVTSCFSHVFTGVCSNMGLYTTV